MKQEEFKTTGYKTPRGTTSYGIIYYNDMRLDLQQDPYLDDSKKFYKAYALDEHNRQYRITWMMSDVNAKLWDLYKVEELY